MIVIVAVAVVVDVIVAAIVVHSPGGGGATPRLLGRQLPLPRPPQGPPANSQLPKVSPLGVYGRQRRPMLHEHQRCPKENFVHFAPQHYP